MVDGFRVQFSVSDRIGAELCGGHDHACSSRDQHRGSGPGPGSSVGSSARLSVCPSVGRSARLAARPSVRLAVHRAARLAACPFVHRTASFAARLVVLPGGEEDVGPGHAEGERCERARPQHLFIN